MKKTILFIALFTFSVSGFCTVATVTTSGYSFSPSSLTINPGDSIMFLLPNIHNAVEVSLTTWNANDTIQLTGGFAVPFGGGIVLPAQLGEGVHYFVCQAHAQMGTKGAITVSRSSSSTVTFQTLYGLTDSTSDSWAANIPQTADGGYITVGYISNFGAGGDDISLLKLNSDGDSAWLKIYGTPSDDDAAQMIKTSDGGSALVGFTSSDLGGNAFLLKTDASGNLTWSKFYGTGDSTSDSWFSSATQLADSDYVMDGYVSNYGGGSDDFYLVKTDASGNIIWTKTYGGSNADDAYSMTPANDGGYAMAGKTNSFNDTLGDVFLVKTDANGDTLWSWDYGSGLTDAVDQANSIQQTSDHGYIIAGFTQSASQGNYALLLKTDSSGALQWTKLYGNGTAASNALAQAVVQTTDGGYAFAGYTSNFGAGQRDYYLVKTDASGDTVFTRTFGGSGDDYASGITQTTDGGYMIAGWTDGFLPTAGGGHAYYVKTDSNGHTGDCYEYNASTSINTSITFYSYRVAPQVSSGGVATSATFTLDDGGTMIPECAATTGIGKVNNPSLSVSVYPVPFSEEATVKITSQDHLQPCVFVMCDIMGREVSRVMVPDGLQFNIYSGSLVNGLYLYRIMNDSQLLYNGKLIIAR